MSTDPLLRVTNLHRHFGRLHAVRGVSFSLRRGEVLGLLGINGAGKSTTLRMLAGVLAASAGDITVAEASFDRHAERARRLIGYLPERAPLYPELTVEEYLCYCARLRGANERSALPAVIERFDLGEVRRRIIGTLSKGFQQRVGFAQAILHEPPLVILDEPMTGLDPVQNQQVRTLVRDLTAEHAVILSSHVLPDIQACCDRVLMMAVGRIVLDSPLRDLDGDGSRTGTRVRLRAPPDDAALLAIDGVRGVERRADGERLLLHDADDDIAERIAARAVNAGWGLQELTRERAALEQHFMRLACGNPAVDDEP